MKEIKNESLDLVSGGKQVVQLADGKWIVVRDNYATFDSEQDALNAMESTPVNEPKPKNPKRPVYKDPNK